MPRLIDTLPPPTGEKHLEMEVLVLGMPRTGTKTIKTALDQLGIKTYHTVEAMRNEHLKYWLEAYKAKFGGQGKPFGRTEFDKLLGKYQGVSDAPCVAFADELLAAYPDTRVILSLRDPDSWFNSISNTGFKIVGWESWKYLLLLRPKTVSAWYYTAASFLNLTSRANPSVPYTVIPNPSTPYTITPQFSHWTRANFQRTYAAHNAHIRAIVRADRLLEFRVQQGWGPLCSFLGKEAPEGDFPHLNGADMSAELMSRLWLTLLSESLGNLAKFLAPLIVLAASIMWWRQHGV